MCVYMFQQLITFSFSIIQKYLSLNFLNTSTHCKSFNFDIISVFDVSNLILFCFNSTICFVLLLTWFYKMKMRWSKKNWKIHLLQVVQDQILCTPFAARSLIFVPDSNRSNVKHYSVCQMHRSDHSGCFLDHYSLLFEVFSNEKNTSSDHQRFAHRSPKFCQLNY